MVKIVNEFGDVLTGKCSNAIYQKHYGRQIRRKGYKEKKQPSPAQLKQRNKFKDAIAWTKSLTTEERIGLKNYYETSKLGYQKNMPVNWYNFAKYVYIKSPTFTILDPTNQTYQIKHPSILKITEKASDGSIINIIDNLSDYENGIITDNYTGTPNIITNIIEVMTMPGLLFEYIISPYTATSKYFDSKYFDIQYFE